VSASSDRVVVIGAGASSLVLELVAAGYRRIQAIDISAAALEQLRGRLGADADAVEFVCSDVRTIEFEDPVDVWHDRATFHFLTNPDDRAAYAARATAAVRPGGHLLIATFAPSGPDQCSGLPVMRFSAEALAAEFSDGFEPTGSFEHEHLTPWGASQAFVHLTLRRVVP